MFLQLGVGFLQREAGRSRSRFGRFVQQLSGSCKHQCEGPHAANKGNKPAFEPVGSSSVTLSSILFWCDFGGDGGSIRRRSVDRIPQLSYQCLSFTGAHTVIGEVEEALGAPLEKFKWISHIYLGFFKTGDIAKVHVTESLSLWVIPITSTPRQTHRQRPHISPITNEGQAISQPRAVPGQQASRFELSKSGAKGVCEKKKEGKTGRGPRAWKGDLG
ncbi:hypothetical protein HDV57DRAFT_7000 [Trichoderma longibrachiatum]